MQSDLFPVSTTLQRVDDADIVGVLADVLRTANGGSVTREVSVYLASVAAETVAEGLARAGMVVARRV